MPSVITRFAPSPTGYLHIGGARTALFNYLYAKHNNGKFLLRIEDTDQKRSTKEAINVIIDGLKWLGMDHDGEIVYQSQRVQRHTEVVKLLVEKGKAYYCYCKAEEKKEIKNKKKHKCIVNNDKNLNPVVRFKVPEAEEIIIDDKVHGKIKINSSELDDIIIFRSDSTPTYIFAVVVDDYDSGITHVIRGSDHLTNTFKQFLIYKALDWNVPHFAHIPLIHDENGNKLSKRRNVTSICDYKTMGVLPIAMRNYLLRLGWSHGNDEIISDEDAIKLFDLENIGRGPAKFDIKKLEHLNNYYISNMENEEIINLMIPLLDGQLLTDKQRYYLSQGLTELKKRVCYLNELPKLAEFYIKDLPIDYSQEALLVIKSNLDIINLLISVLFDIDDKDWNKDYLSSQIKEFIKLHSFQPSEIYRSLRASITGIMDAPSILDIMIILSKDECIKRLKYVTRV
ncbi:glutamate--tRNA ligase [Wolbachia endosymbiont of Pentidionis agamae]|uniref:glutamate--tRNA ligase n=1 Tax=Wolbachia endosymbiont of Pentidionis agamae TaxID=3110435 RepID=UPI002FD45DB4